MAAKPKTDAPASAVARGEDSASSVGARHAQSAPRAAPQRPLLLAGASVRSLAESTCRLRLQPWCRDDFGDADLRRLLEFHGGRYCGPLSSFAALPELVRDVDPDIPILCGGGIENQLDALEELRRQRRVLNMSPAAMRCARDAESLAAAMSRRDVRFPETRTARTFTRPAGPARWVFKPRNGGGGRGIRFLNPNESAVAEDGFCQQFLEGVPLSALFVARPGRSVELIGATLQCIGWPELGGSGFQYCGTIGPLRLPDRLRTELLRIAAAVADACRPPSPAAGEFLGLFGLDLLLRAGDLWLIEVNPRIPASHELHESRGRSPLLFHLECFPEVSRRIRADLILAGREPIRAAARCVLVVYNSGTTVLNPFDTSRIMPACGIRLTPDRVRPVWAVDIPQPGLLVARGHPLCSLRGTAARLAELPQAIGGLRDSPLLPAWIAKTVTPHRIAARLTEALGRFKRECEPG